MINRLNNCFGVEDKIKFFTGEGGLPFVKISSEHSTAVVCLYGAHVISFTPRGGSDLLWVSKDAVFERSRAIRGGIPVCWPWFGAHPENGDAPAHGFARLSEWTFRDVAILRNGDVRILLQLYSDGEFAEFWRHNTQAIISITAGRELDVKLSTLNIGDEAVSVSSALHSYFSVSDIENVRVRGLENERFLDMLTGVEAVEQDAVAVRGEIDRVYLEHSGECLIEDSGAARAVRIAKSGSNSTVVWNPWVDKSMRMSDFGDNEYRKMICVETTNSHEDARMIKPGEEHIISTMISPV